MKANPKIVDALIETPLCKAEDLGKAIPASEHANSVCLPRWADNVGYEEGDPAVVDRVTLCLLVLLRLKKDSPLTSIVLDSARTQFTPETPEVFCGLTPPPPPPSPPPQLIFRMYFYTQAIEVWIPSDM